MTRHGKHEINGSSAPVVENIGIISARKIGNQVGECFSQYFMNFIV